MINNLSNNKRIALNTIMLYFRMFLTMGVSLYTSRVILQSLGISDYGIYNVVAGFVSMFTFMNSAMTSATQRYITFAIGEDNYEKTNTVFCTCINIHALFAIVLIIIAETFGVWFLNTHMTIPSERMVAANVVFQLAILSTAVMMISVPYNALIVAHEKMSAFAYISIMEVSCKLLIAFILCISPFDRLILYAILMLFVQLIVRQVYGFYCRKHFKESKYRLIWNKSLFKDLMSFSVWSLFGNLASVCSGQGLNVVLNMYFGPVVNAARGVAYQVQSAIQGFSGNFQMAINPQITKNYASGNISYMHSLIYASSKYSFYLLLLLSLPVILEADFILSVWLKDIPEHTCGFLRITLCTVAINALAGPFTISAQANGNIKAYQAAVGGILLLTLPVSFILLKFLEIPEVVYAVDLVVVILAQIVRLFFMKRMINLSIKEYAYKVILPISSVTLMAVMPSFCAYHFLPDKCLQSFLVVCCVCFFSIGSMVYLIGITNTERSVVNEFIKKQICKWFK